MKPTKIKLLVFILPAILVFSTYPFIRNCEHKTALLSVSWPFFYFPYYIPDGIHGLAYDISRIVESGFTHNDVYFLEEGASLLLIPLIFALVGLFLWYALICYENSRIDKFRSERKARTLLSCLGMIVLWYIASFFLFGYSVSLVTPSDLPVFGCGGHGVMSIDGVDSYCANHTLTLSVRNDGNSAAENIKIEITYPNETVVTSACSIARIEPGTAGGANCTISSVNATGLYVVRAYAGGEVATGSIYCS